QIPINAFMERLADKGILMLDRERNRYAMPDDVRWHLLEHLPGLDSESWQGAELGEDEDIGGAPI
ncbi:MAG TPA: hypothetical protein VFV52_05460, partial [Bacilli bacterium]|nr:hypothetical protein [Bacilli bacterium]